MERDKYGIPIIRCDTAGKFLAELDETHERWRGGRWLYRGQNNAAWELHPRAMRSHVIQKFVVMYPDVNSLPKSVQRNWKDIEENKLPRMRRWLLQGAAERELVRSFEELADQAGLAIPADRVAIVGGDDKPSTFEDRFFGGNVNPSRVAYALAQHHGIPTRLMDWTFRPLYAAFFAAHLESVLEPTPDFLIVWAVRAESLRGTDLRIASHARGDIGFLQSQDGVFIYDHAASEKFMESGRWQPLESELCKAIGDKGVYKLILPFSEHENLLELLRLKRVSKPFLMPSFDNVAEEIVSERLDWTRLRDGLP